MRDFWKVLGLLSAVMLLPACSGDAFNSSTASGDGGGTAPGCGTDSTDPACSVTAGSVIATTDKVSIKSDGFDEATITATVLDTSRAAIKDVTVTFVVTTGKLTTAVGITDENGQVTTKFSASPDNPSNGTTFVTASVSGAGSYAVPITIAGTTLELSADDGKNTLVVSTSPTKILKVKAANAAGLGVYGASIAFTFAGDEDGLTADTTGSSISPNPATTDITGTATVTWTGTVSGEVWITATGLGADSEPEKFLVQDANALRISSPTLAAGEDYVRMVSDSLSQFVDSNGTVTGASTITVTAGPGNWNVGETVWLTTTLGHWSNGRASIGIVWTAAGTSASVTDTLTADPGDNGFATVFVFGATTGYNDSVPVAMSPPVSDAAQITVQTDEKTLFPNSSTTTYTTTVRVQVITNDATGNYPIANAPVALTLENSTGGGEHLSQGFGFTDVYGNFVTTFTSGVTPTGQKGVRIVAEYDPIIPLATPITSSATVEIGGVAGSVALGTPREVEQTKDNKSINTYIMSAVVADGTGAAVSGAPVTLHIWPKEYRTGVWVKFIDVDGGEHFSTWTTGSFKNEDLDEDGILDPGEDLDGDEILDAGEDTNGNGILDLSEDVNRNGQLDPQGSYAGTIPPTVTTGNDGAAPFNYVYLKDAAEWVTVRAQGSTRVFGTEASTTTEFIPHSLKVEVDEGRVNNSPFTLWLFVDISDATGVAIVPGTTTAWVAPGTTVTVDKGSINGTNNYVLPIGTYVAGNTETVTVTSDGIQFPLSIKFIP